MTTRKQLIYKNSKKIFRKTRSKKGGVTTRSGINTTKSKAIKATRKTKKSKLSPETTDVCGICLEDLNKTDDIPKLSCNHKFHKDCLIEWCKSKNNRDVKCPLCRGDIVDVCKDINPQPDYVGFAPSTPEWWPEPPPLTMADLEPDDVDFTTVFPDTPPLLTMADLEPDDVGFSSRSPSYSPQPLTMADLELDVPTTHSFNDFGEEEYILRNGNVGDLVNFEPNNQMGIVYYKISLNNGEKYLEAIGDYEGYYDDPNYGMLGGKGKRKRKTKRGGGNINMELIQASRNGRTETVEMLLADGADVNAKDNYGEMALPWASRNGHKETVAILLKNGADVNSEKSDGYTALQVASIKGYKEIVAILLKNGAIINAKDEDGNTALQMASENGHTEIVKLLKQHIIQQIVPTHLERQEDKKNLDMLMSVKYVGNRGDVTMPDELQDEIRQYVGGIKTRKSNKPKKNKNSKRNPKRNPKRKSRK